MALLSPMRRLLVVVLAVLSVAAPAAAARTNDPYVDQQYHLEKVRVFEAWARGQGADVVVAVLDTGVSAGHPDLKGRVVAGIDLVDPGTAPDDPNGHGTLVAGIVAANVDNGEGVAGAAPQVAVMPVRVLDDDGSGDAADVAEGIRWAADRGAGVINLSLAEAPGQQAGLLAALITPEVEQAIRYADRKGALVVAAAGNDGASRVPYASDLPVLVVGATDRDDRVWPSSNRDARTLFAPGVGIVSTWNRAPYYGEGDGTSFAAPIVAAGAALLRSSGLNSAQARERLTASAVPVGEGLGRVDLARAVDAAPAASSPQAPRSPSPAARPGAEGVAQPPAGTEQAQPGATTATLTPRDGAPPASGRPVPAADRGDPLDSAADPQALPAPPGGALAPVNPVEPPRGEALESVALGTPGARTRLADVPPLAPPLGSVPTPASERQRAPTLLVLAALLLLVDTSALAAYTTAHRRART